MRAVVAPLLLLLTAAAAIGAVLAIHRIESAGSPIGQPRVTRWFSPNDDGRLDTAAVRLTPDRHDRMSVVIVDDNGTVVRNLAHRIIVRAGRSVELEWDGRTGDDATADEGTYHAQVVLHDLGRSFNVQSPIVVDVTPPRIGSVLLDLTRVETLGAVRARARGVTEAAERYLELDGTRLRTRQEARPADVREARTFTEFFISASLPDGTTPTRAARTQLVVVDRAGNLTRASGTVAEGALQPPGRKRSSSG